MCEFNLINAANSANLLKYNWVRSETQLFEFEAIESGIPILVEADEQIFDFGQDDIFRIEPNVICQAIYGHNDQNYVGFKHAFRKFSPSKPSAGLSYTEDTDRMIPS